MQELIWLIEPIRVWLNGGSAEEITRTEGFMTLAVLGAVLIPSSLIAWGMGTTAWRETPLAHYLGVARDDPDANWAERARDTDKDGLPDF